jgi:transcription antitermination protein NusB
MKEHPHAQKRHLIRERVMQALYAFELSKDPLPHIVETILAELPEDESTFAKDLLFKTVKYQDALDDIIKEKTDNWDFGRIAVIDKLLLRMGICELCYFDDIPPKVSINEAIEIAKRFSTEKSSQFINGILDSILHDMQKKGTLAKRGRGLLNNSVNSGKKHDTHPTEKQ